jgi:hypothetical protein
MEPDADAPNLGETEDAPIYDRASALLGEGKTVVAPPALENGKARRLPRFDATEERLLGAVKRL